MKKIYRILVGLLVLCASNDFHAQCNANEAEVIIEIVTDNYGYEGYWQLTPGGNACA
jgi:hypothetical protein